MTCLWDGEDGIYKLWRLTNNNLADGASHVDASKLLVLAAMEGATTRNPLLETDGSTPGRRQTRSNFQAAPVPSWVTGEL